jgi:hypothetical protein
VTSWREFAESRQWWKIEVFLLTKEERAELQRALEGLVPIVEQGHGIEKFMSHMLPRDARTVEQRDMAQLLQSLATHDFHSPKHDFLRDAVNLSISVIEDHGFIYEGFNTTYLYWDREWKQVYYWFATALREKMFRLLQDGRLLSERDWMERYPWRCAMPLSFHFRQREFGIYTPLWHSLNILSCYSAYNGAKSGRSLLNASEATFEMGRSYDALLKKPYEQHALVGIKNLAGRQKGAAVRRAQTRPPAEAVLAEMRRLIENHGLSASSAALTATKRGFGTSQEANRKLWQRRKK